MTLSGMTRSALVALGAAAASAEHGLQLAAAGSSWQAPPTLPPYDCHAMYDDGQWKMAWTPDWKAWCCENEARGCPSTTTTTATSSTATSTTRTTTVTSTATTTTTEGEGCAAMCEVDGVNNTCGDRIRWATAHEERKKKQPCGAARDLVLSQCSVCGGCSLKAAGCEDEEGRKDEKASEHAKQDEDEKASDHDDDEKKKHAEKDEEGKAEAAASDPAKEQKNLRFRKKFEETAEATGPAPAAHGLGFFARCSLAGLAAGVPLAVVFRRSLRTAAAGGPELREQIYERAVVHGEDAEANE